jgi:TRAP transporter 4TM/12TM fusion protein
MENTVSETKNKKNYNQIVVFLAIILVGYILYTKLTYPPDAFYDRAIYMGISLLMLCCFQLPTYKGIGKVFVVLGTMLSVGACIYIMFSVDKIMGNMYRADMTDSYVYIFYFIGVLILLQSSLGGRIIGAMGIIIMAYLFLGRYIPGVLNIPPLTIKHVATMVFTDTDQGSFGTFLAITSRVLSIFLLFSSLLVATGLGELIRAVSMMGAGKTKGGPAKVAVIASALFGMLSGSPVANVAATGSFTIPLMKSIGYKPTTAGAIETVASSGGNITPPIMGLSAFIMCEILGVPYTKVMVWAMIPAFLWYFTTFLFVHFSAYSQDVKSWTPKKEELVEIVKGRWHLVISIFILIYFLITLRVPELAALYATISLFLISFLRKETRLDRGKIQSFLIHFSKAFAGLAILNTMLGIFTAGLLSTGTHTKLIHLIFGGINHWFPISLIIFGLCIIFGMVVPPFAAYVAIVVIAAPIFNNLGFELSTIHMFVLYGCALAPITPPVALAAYTAAGIADADAIQTAKEASIQALPLWIFPFLLLRDNLFLGMGTGANILIINILMIMTGVLVFTVAVNRYWVERIPKQLIIFLYALTIAIMQPLSMTISLVSCLIGIGILGFLYFNKNKKQLAID